MRQCRSTAAPTTRISPANTAASGPAPRISRWAPGSCSRTASPGQPFQFVPVRRPEAPADAPRDYPFALVFGHSLYYWHQNVLIKHSETLKREIPHAVARLPGGLRGDQHRRRPAPRRPRRRARSGSCGGQRLGGQPRRASRARCAAARCSSVTSCARSRRQILGETGLENGHSWPAGLRQHRESCVMKARILASRRRAARSWTCSARRATRWSRRSPGADATALFDTVTDENRDQIQIHCPIPIIRPSATCFPHIERLLKCATANGTCEIEPTYDETQARHFRHPVVRHGRHLAPRPVLSRARIPRHLLRQAPARICSSSTSCAPTPERDIDEACFCVCADTGPAARDHFDLQLMDLRQG